MLRRPLILVAVLASSLVTLTGCDQLGIESATVTAARLEADGKAVGAACRHGGRAIEDCFTLNKRVDKAAIYAGWREMDDYMRENKMEAVAPTLGADARSKTADAGDAADAPASRASSGAKSDKSADKVADKAADKGAADKPAKVDKLAKSDKASDKAGDKPADKSDKTASADADKPVAAR
jgi:hypothetical protein